MKNVLLVDTNFSSGPIYTHLAKAGFNVHVVGGNPDDFLARGVPGYIEVDYSDLEALIRVVETYQIDHVVPGCNDFSYEMCARLGERLPRVSTDSADVTATLFNKKAFRQFSLQQGLSVPGLLDEQAPDTLQGKALVVKPADSFSGKGISVLPDASKDQLAGAIELARANSRTGQFLVEEFVQGQLYSHSAFLSGQKIQVDFFVREHCSVNPKVVDISCVEFGFPDTMAQNIRAQIEKMAGALGLSDGLIHTQFIASEDQFWLIEVTRRCPGDLYSRLVERSTGFPYAAAYASFFVGQAMADDAQASQQRHFMRHTITQKQDCVLFGLDIDIGYPFEFLPLAITGDRLQPSPLGRVGLLFVEAPGQDELNALMQRTAAGELYSIDLLIHAEEQERQSDDEQ